MGVESCDSLVRTSDVGVIAKVGHHAGYTETALLAIEHFRFACHQSLGKGAVVVSLPRLQIHVDAVVHCVCKPKILACIHHHILGHLLADYHIVAGRVLPRKAICVRGTIILLYLYIG